MFNRTEMNIQAGVNELKAELAELNEKASSILEMIQSLEEDGVTLDFTHDGLQDELADTMECVRLQRASYTKQLEV